MAIRKSGPIKFSELQAEFGGTEPISLSEYYRGSGSVDDIAFNGTIPSGGEISVEDFYDTGIGIRSGEVSMTEPGSYFFTVPSGLTEISVLLIGGGGGGGAGDTFNDRGGGGGGGGGAHARSGIPVVPGETYIFFIGEGGWGGFDDGVELRNGAPGGNSILYDENGNILMFAGGGGGGRSASTGNPGARGIVNNIASNDKYGYGGLGGYGQSGASANGGGGGGAGGYGSRSTSSGGDGGDTNFNNGDNGSNGGGGGAGGTRTEYFYGGGGVGIFPDSADQFPPNGEKGFSSTTYQDSKGHGGSWGEDGQIESLNINNWYQFRGGGLFGGGGSGASGSNSLFTSTPDIRPGRAGAHGAARLIWAANGDTIREFPTTNSAQEFSSGFYTTEYVESNYTPTNANTSGVVFTSTSSTVHNWTVPDGITSVNILCISGGGGGASSAGGDNNRSGGGGGGGGLSYTNNVSVTPGQVLTINVGRGGGGGLEFSRFDGNEGGDSFVTHPTLGIVCCATGAHGGNRQDLYSFGGNLSSLSGRLPVGDGINEGGGGGRGGSQKAGGGGGGAAGYSGSGGRGGDQSTGNYDGKAGTGGGGGGGAMMISANIPAVNFGGGVGIYGEGSNGSGGTFSTSNPSISDGSPGSNGSFNKYGGGGGTTEDDTGGPGGGGSAGVVRIMWDSFASSSFPSTNVGNTGSEQEF